jgi:predicted secreted hydrolase
MHVQAPPDSLDSLDEDTRESVRQALWLDALLPEDLPGGIQDRLVSPENSNRAFGRRMQRRIREMLAAPDSFTPSYKQRYETLLRNCDTLSAHQAYAMSVLLGQDNAKGYSPIPDVAGLRFPDAHPEDLQAQVGWYFCVGSCSDRKGKEYGVEVMFFRYALLPPALARQFKLSDIENQVVELHFAISVAGGRHHRMKPIVVAGTTGLIDYATKAVSARMGKNVIRSLSETDLFPLRVEARGTCHEPDGSVEVGVELTLSSEKPPLLQGANGCSPCCGGVGTLYYSIPDLLLDATSSTLSINGDQVELVDGKFWFDHQWGTGMIPAGSPRPAVLRAAGSLAEPGAGGWDWFMAHFSEGRALTFYSLHANEFRDFYSRSGPTAPGTMRVPISGKYMDPSGTVTEVAGVMEITRWIRSVTTPDAEQYPATRTWHPDRWEFTLEDIPEDLRRFNMVPIVSTGQSGFFAFGAQYSEGAVYLQDEQGNDVGRGFAESVLYADARRTIVTLAGLPDTETMMKTFEPERPSRLAKLWATAYRVWPPNAKKLKQTLAQCLANGLQAPAPKPRR